MKRLSIFGFQCLAIFGGCNLDAAAPPDDVQPPDPSPSTRWCPDGRCPWEALDSARLDDQNLARGICRTSRSTCYFLDDWEFLDVLRAAYHFDDCCACKKAAWYEPSSQWAVCLQVACDAVWLPPSLECSSDDLVP